MMISRKVFGTFLLIFDWCRRSLHTMGGVTYAVVLRTIKSKLSNPWKQTRQIFFLHGFCFSSCLRFLPWVPGLSSCPDFQYGLSTSVKLNKPFPSLVAFGQCFITIIETPTKAEVVLIPFPICFNISNTWVGVIPAGTEAVEPGRLCGQVLSTYFHGDKSFSG